MTFDDAPRQPLCTICRHRSAPCAPGLALLRHLQKAHAVAAWATSPEFELSGAAKLDCDGASCPLVFLMSERGVYVFGDVVDAAAADDLAAFADWFLGAPGAAATDRGQARVEPVPAAMCVAPSACAIARVASQVVDRSA